MSFECTIKSFSDVQTKIPSNYKPVFNIKNLFFMDILISYATQREVIKIEDVYLDEARSFAEEVRAKGYKFTQILKSFEPSLTKRRLWDTDEETFIFIASKKRTILKEISELIPLEKNSSQNRNSVIERIGELLGYPFCCIKKFSSLPCQDDSAVIKELIISNVEKIISPYLNIFLPALSLIPHYPCSFFCSESIAMAKRVHQYLNCYYRKIGGKILSILDRSLICFDKFRSIILSGNKKNGKIHYNKVLTTAMLHNDRRIFDSKEMKYLHQVIFPLIKSGNIIEPTKYGFEVLKNEKNIAKIYRKDYFPVLINFETRHLLNPQSKYRRKD